jgi:hypothetical protein
MTPDEKNMLTELANKVAQTPAPPKDPEAEDFIRTRIGSRPDALYLMTQTVLIQNMALEQAQQQIAQLQGGGQGQVPGGSFLGAGGSRGYNAGPSGSSYAAPPPQQQYTQYSAPPPQAAQAPSGQPSFLRGAAQTAAGVAAGALAFEGVRSLFEHPGYGGGGMLGGGGGFGGAPQEEVVNNYYDSPGGGNDYQAANDTNDYQDDNVDNGQSDDGGGFDDDQNFA